MNLWPILCRLLSFTYHMPSWIFLNRCCIRKHVHWVSGCLQLYWNLAALDPEYNFLLPMLLLYLLSALLSIKEQIKDCHPLAAVLDFPPFPENFFRPIWDREVANPGPILIERKVVQGGLFKSLTWFAFYGIKSEFLEDSSQSQHRLWPVPSHTQLFFNLLC